MADATPHGPGPEEDSTALQSSVSLEQDQSQQESSLLPFERAFQRFDALGLRPISLERFRSLVDQELAELDPD